MVKREQVLPKHLRPMAPHAQGHSVVNGNQSGTTRRRSWPRSRPPPPGQATEARKAVPHAKLGTPRWAERHDSVPPPPPPGPPRRHFPGASSCQALRDFCFPRFAPPAVHVSLLRPLFLFGAAPGSLAAEAGGLRVIEGTFRKGRRDRGAGRRGGESVPGGSVRVSALQGAAADRSGDAQIAAAFPATQPASREPRNLAPSLPSAATLPNSPRAHSSRLHSSERPRFPQWKPWPLRAARADRLGESAPPSLPRKGGSGKLDAGEAPLVRLSLLKSEFSPLNKQLCANGCLLARGGGGDGGGESVCEEGNEVHSQPEKFAGCWDWDKVGGKNPSYNR